MTTSSITGIDALPADVWPVISQALSNSDICNLSSSNKAGWKFSCDKRSLKVELDADQNLQDRLASLLHYLTSRREYLQVIVFCKCKSVCCL